MRGGTAIKEARAEAKRRQEENQNNFVRRFMLMEDGESAVVRFLESGDDIVSAYAHSIKLPNRKMPVFILCRDQDPETGARIGEDCPGCESTDPAIARRSLRGAINLIWRDGPVFERDNEGKVVTDSRGRWVVASREDQIAVWTAGPTVFDDLVTEDIETPGGLTGRDWKVTRNGTGKETTYDIRPAERDGGQKAMSKADKELAAQKYELTEFETPRPYENWWGSLAENNSSANNRPRPSFARQAVPADVSPFTQTDDD